MNNIGQQGRPLLIAGPCSAESEQQVLETARGLVALGQVHLFRSGLWKPRTRPGDFEGVGEKGLAWLQRVKKETGLPLMVEVARPGHVEQCLQAGIKVMWIGSRTIVNPFSIEELARAFEGSDATVFVKNPVSPDLALWLGALERLELHGIRRLAAIHRGFSVPDPGPYRNAPLWPLAVELKKVRPGIPLIADPSHICGNRRLLASVAQHALDNGYDGLMFESHQQPEKALTDREQQINPEELGEILKKLELSPATPDKQPLDNLRLEIDGLDDALITILAKRMAVSEKIGALKKELGLDVEDPGRWEKVLKDRLVKAELSGIEKKFLKNILEEIHRESIKKQSS